MGDPIRTHTDVAIRPTCTPHVVGPSHESIAFLAPLPGASRVRLFPPAPLPSTLAVPPEARVG